jgi:hypothetical protein
VITPLRRRLAAAALVLLVPTMTACGIGFDQQTDKVYQAGTGSDNRSGQVYVLNAAIVSATDGTGTFAGTLVNTNQTTADALVSIAGGTGGPVALAPNASVNLAASGAVKIANPTIKAGGYLQITLQFQSGQTTTMNVPVVARVGDYANVPVS